MRFRTGLNHLYKAPRALLRSTLWRCTLDVDDFADRSIWTHLSDWTSRWRERGDLMTVETSPHILSHGTLEIRDVQESMRFYRDFLRMKVLQHVPTGCLIWLQEGWYIVCLETKNAREMPLLNHFGIDVSSREEVDRWHERALSEQEPYGISKITNPKVLHEAYQFFIKDRDNNWWEVQHSGGAAAPIRATAPGG